MQFNVSFDLADSPDLASLTASEQQAVLDTANAAANIWSWYLTPANVTLDLALIVDSSLFSGTTLAEGGPEVFYRSGGSFAGKPIYESNTAIELRTGRDLNGSAADLHIDLTVNSIRNLLAFKTDDTAPVVRGRNDALSVFLHEIGHGLGFMSFDGDSSAVSIYDTFVQNGYFTGANAESAAGTPSGVPLEPGSLSHIAESGAFGADLMSPRLSTGANVHISAIDLGFLQDMGVPVRQATAGPDVMHALFGAALHLGAGDDTGYAINGGSTLYGDDGNDQLYGGEGNDALYGGNGFDTAHYSSLASSYQITSLSAVSFQIRDLRSGAPDGTDVLTDVERVQWSDGSISVLFDSTPRQRNDFSGDGKADVLWQNNDGTAAIWTMNGTNRLGGDTLSPNPGPSWHVIGSGDFNGDRKAEVLWQNDDGTAAVWFMNGVLRTGGDTLSPNPGPAWQVKAAGDFNGDAKADVLWQNNDGTVAVWTMNGTTRTGGDVISSNPGSSWHVIGSGDFNGDAKADILFQNDDGRAAVWLVNGFSLLQGAVVSDNPGTSWHVKGSGDFNGDGKSDILWQNDDGRAAIWLMDGIAMTSGAAISPNPGPSWSVKGAADVNGDSRADIFWQNSLTGEAAVWIMSGVAKIGGDTLSPNPSTAWHLVANAG